MDILKNQVGGAIIHDPEAILETKQTPKRLGLAEYFDYIDCSYFQCFGFVFYNYSKHWFLGLVQDWVGPKDWIAGLGRNDLVPKVWLPWH